MTVFNFTPGTTPLLVSLPHVGTLLPEAIAARCVPAVRELDDTDWHLERLYDFAAGLGASVIRANFSRYIIDLNRPPDNQPMYIGANNTELCPSRFFTGEPIYRLGQEPSLDEVIERRERYWQPYHAKLQSELDRIRVHHGYAILYDAHSIRSELPWLFPGRLPDLNLGTADGTSCSARLRDGIMNELRSVSGFTSVCDGRFKGGYITRHYGRPVDGIHAVQMELCQCLYMSEVRPYAYGSDREPALKAVLKRLLQNVLEQT